MDGVIFAAGLGTRLRPLTDRVPKALVEVGGVPLVEVVARRLVAAGVTRLVVNVCPFADDVARFVERRGGFGVDVRLSVEAPEPLETGGGLWAARALLSGDGPVLLHNVDVVTDLPLAALLEAHRRAGALATLAVMDRPTTRRLLFDERGLFGRVDASSGLRAIARPPVGRVVELAFAGVHAIDPALLDRTTERGRFSILDPYLRLAGEGAAILPHRVDGCAWIDVGRPADLERANAAARAAAPRPA